MPYPITVAGFESTIERLTKSSSGHRGIVHICEKIKFEKFALAPRSGAFPWNKCLIQGQTQLAASSRAGIKIQPFQQYVSDVLVAGNARRSNIRALQSMHCLAWKLKFNHIQTQSKETMFPASELAGQHRWRPQRSGCLTKPGTFRTRCASYWFLVVVKFTHH